MPLVLRVPSGVDHAPPGLTAGEIAAHSQSLLDAALDADGELLVAAVENRGALLGAFQRPCEVTGEIVHRRISGGPCVRLGPRTVYVALALRRPDVLVRCDATQLVNRHVRPLLAALTRSIGRADYFGRDWISILKHPATWVGFAHDTRTGRAALEAVVAVHEPFWDRTDRASFRGKTPRTLEDLRAQSLDPTPICEAITRAYVDAYAPGSAVALPFEPRSASTGADEPPWASAVEAAIGAVHAGPDASGRLRLGGELLASRDAIRDLEDALHAAPPSSAAAVGPIVERSFRARGAAWTGVTAEDVALAITRALFRT